MLYVIFKIFINTISINFKKLLKKLLMKKKIKYIYLKIKIKNNNHLLVKFINTKKVIKK